MWTGRKAGASTTTAGKHANLVRVGGTVGGGTGTLTVSCGNPADIDGDGLVGAADLLMLLGQWGPCPPECSADVDADSTVAVGDLLMLLSNWSP